jgi:hypothetical protein
MGAKSSMSAWSRVSRFTELETGEGTEGPASPRRRRSDERREGELCGRTEHCGAVGRAIVSKEANAMPGNLLILLPVFRLPSDFAGRVGFVAAIEVHRARKLEV